MVFVDHARTEEGGYMAVGSFLFLKEQIKGSIIIITTIVKRSEKGHDGKVDVNTVDHCVQYNLYMGGCDVVDMKHALGMSRSKTYNWYLALFFYVIDVAVINAGVVWYSLKGQTASGRTREWWMELLMLLVAEGQGVDH
jgi:hypothetical protein